MKVLDEAKVDQKTNYVKHSVNAIIQGAERHYGFGVIIDGI